MAFMEIEFFRKLALNAQGGPAYSTTVNQGFSGYEQRNQNWSQSRGQWDVEFSHRPYSDYQELLAFIHAAKGQANGFRLHDPTDNSMTGQFIGTGDGSMLTFQLQKTYTFPLSSYEVVRPIQKPITSAVVDFYGNALSNTVVVYDNGAVTSNWTVDPTTGIVSFTSGHAPVAGHIITADCQYHYPVRFALDQFKAQSETPEAAGLVITVAGIQLQEVRIALGQSAG